MMEIIPAVMQPPRRVESCLLQRLIPTEQSTSCLRWHFHLKDLTAPNLVALFFPFPPAEKSSAWWCRGLVVHLCGQAEPAACRWNAALSAAGLKQSYWQQSSYVKAHTLTQQSCSLRTLELELLTFRTKSLFLLLLALQSHGALGGWAGFYSVLHIINKIVS